jgi:putative sigma-54 modulation protein
MQVNVSFRHMDASPAVQQYASDKLQHVVSKYVQGADIDSQITFSVEKFWHIANFTININGLTVKCMERSEDMYSSIDLALEKIERQVRRYKTRIRTHRPDQRARDLALQVVQAPPAEEAEPEETAEASAIPEIEKEFFTAPFMSADAAVVQLELSGNAFLVFTNEDTERINIVYKREDEHFGLIDVEPEHH